ncbi:GerMN domain-containing protein [Demequina globuliformis]|uniref:GerMN domain-containing protein n=1 Tax=Demequina globuliformis TaxID=676202 RepID=UPI0007806B2B|nr:GerMN domain-containing protein [Demequina globuliformis]
MRKTWAALACVSALTLGACASIPTEGPVTEGNGEVSPIDPFEPIVQGPAPEDDPAAIVTGFLTASAGGITTDFSTAREFLTDEAAATWDPGATVTVYDSGAVAPEWDPDAGTVSYQVPLGSTVDDSGRRVDSTAGEVAQLEFQFVQEDGQWRISELADGVVISRANFESFFRPVPLTFATPDLSTAASELRWLPDNNVATAAARELIEGPSAWLADAVVTGFPATAALAVESVVVTDGVATVDLTAQSAGTLTERALADEQLSLTLKSLPDVTDVDVQIGGLPISDEVDVTLDPPPVPDAYAAIIVDRRLGLWNGADVRVTPGSLGLLPETARDLARSYDGADVAFAAADGIRTTGALSGGWDALVDPAVAEDSGELVQSEVALTMDDPIDPSYDRFGYLWGASASGGPLQVAVDNGEIVELGDEWLSARAINAIAVSRSGTMIAVQSRSGGQPILEVAAIVRDDSGVPISLGEPLPVGPGVGVGVDIAWVDALSFAVLGEPVDGTASPLWTVGVGGATTTLATLREATGVSARSGVSSLVVTGADGTVEERSGTSWSVALEGVADLAYAG